MNLTTQMALAGLALAGGVGRAPAQAQHPDLSGRWTYNSSHSDNPRDMTQGRDSGGGGEGGTGRGGGRRGGFGGRRGGFGGGGGGRGGYGGGGGRGGGMSDEQRARMRQTTQLAFQAPPSLVIAEYGFDGRLHPRQRRRPGAVRGRPQAQTARGWFSRRRDKVAR